MPARTRFLAALLAAILLLAGPRTASAQRVTLDRVDSLMRAGQAEQARAALVEWRRTHSADARATYLSGRLATRAQDAEDAYLTVALTHATSAYAAESLLRLGQARLAAGDRKQAVTYLERVLADYPRSEHRATALEWLDRARETAPQLYSIQVAAFRERAGARSVARQLQQAGFENVRLVTVPDNALIRVRVGKFEDSADAATTASRIKAAGLSAVIVSDVQREQGMRD
ncbi:MAG: SPOR domain-containing protein [Gemmatimonadota bacterium]